MQPIRTVPYLRCIPTTDAVLEACARRALVESRTAAELAARLRPVFPRVKVREQEELAALQPGLIWYVFREGASASIGKPWSGRDDEARAILDDSVRFVDVDDRAASMFGVRRDELIGASPRDFTTSLAGDSLADCVRQLSRVGSVESRWLLYLPDGRRKSVEFRVTNHSDPNRHTAIFREIGQAEPAVATS